MLITGICVAIGVTSLTVRGRDIFSPARMFFLTWSVIIFLAELKLSRLQHEWPIFSWVIVLLGPVSLLAGILLVNAARWNKPTLSLSELRKRLVEQPVDEGKLFWLIILAFIFYLAGYLTIYLVKGYVPVLTSLPAEARKDYTVFGIGLFTHTMPVIVFFVVVYHVLAKCVGWRRHVLKLIGVVTFLTYLLLLQRFQIIMVGIIILTFLHYTTNLIRARTIILSLAISIILFYWVTTLRTGRLVHDYLFYTSAMRIPYSYAIITEPYMYIVMNLENLARSAEKLDQFTCGYYTFDFVTALTGIKHWVAEYFNLNETPYLISGYNTYTMFWTFYRDFGIPGLALVSGLLGGAVGVFYNNLRSNSTVRSLVGYSILMAVLVLSFFNSPLGFLWFVYILAWTWLITWQVFPVAR